MQPASLGDDPYGALAAQGEAGPQSQAGSPMG